MGRFQYWMNVSMDLFIDAAPGEEGAGSWLSIDEPLHRVFNARARELSLAVEGRVIYEIMEPYWPAARNDPDASEVMREYGEIWTSTPKVLVSRTRTSADHNTRIASSIDEVLQIADETDGLIGVGGASIATQLLRVGRLDELLLFTHPVVLGTGRPLFDPPIEPVTCRLLEHEAFDNGVTMHRYAIDTPT